jgi:hypothetical protein
LELQDPSTFFTLVTMAMARNQHQLRNLTLYISVWSHLFW